ncbi:WAP four-disulfide core domain protein 5-like [Ruditapes philippinarum]|uniref:WAP four-disulfide core domain protein 5-like n=1 Tax=Ruditapes philippinarum TaxID=129788 RepID=UPI00295BEDFA|nr:WAP four-disulfide core domain protein 5-like [Ruditapes philippinarum]
MTTPQPQGHASLMIGGRHSKSSYRHQHRRRHYSHHSLIESVSSNGLPAWGLANTERPGRCPTSTPTGPCINSCRIDSDCPQHQKCCENDCGRTCRTTINNATRKPGTCARRLSHVTGSCQRECDVDSDCLGLKKCCTTSCGAICSDPCYYWLQPNQRSNNWKLPFICRY